MEVKEGSGGIEVENPAWRCVGFVKVWELMSGDEVGGDECYKSGECDEVWSEP